ncbi:MAG: amidohydrolase family protein [Enterobacterales bacterium]|nr:amidohydrolase family protein [Enterobacterales bacterium]
MRLNIVPACFTSLLLFFSSHLFAANSCQILVNVTGYTAMQGSKDLTTFNWLAFNKGKVLSIGRGNWPKQFQSCHSIDGQGQFLLPGLIDAHGHVSSLGNEMLRVKLRGVLSEQQAVDRVKQFAQNNSQARWIIGRGWNQVLWLNKAFPSRRSLDATGIKKPVVLTRIDGHAAWLNSKALALAGINDATPDPAGGKILRDAKGKATGILVDNAMNLVAKVMPPNNRIEQEYAFDKAFEHLLSLGITSVHDAGVSALDLSIYQDRVKQHKLPLRIYGMLEGSSGWLNQWLEQGHIQDAEDYLSIRSVKLYSDGALGSRGAALLAPYADDSDNSGLLLTPPDKLQTLVNQILAHHFQVNVHAIGDKGNRMVLDSLESAYKKVGGRQQRNRIEHAQIVALDDIPRFKDLDVIASMQPTHATSDMNMAGDRLGQKRLKGSYAWQTFLKQGTIVASGSDFPVEYANAFYGLHAAVTRQDRNNQPLKGWRVEEAMTPTQALISFTLNAAYAAHQEKVIGSLEKGKWADFILVDRDIINGNPQDIWKTQVLQTWIAGKLRYKK